MVKSALLVVGIQDFNYENIDDNNYRNKVSKFLEYARFIFNSEEIIHINKIATMLYEQSKILDGEKPTDPALFSKSLIDTIYASLN